MENSDSFNPFKPSTPTTYNQQRGATTTHITAPTVRTDAVDNYEPFFEPAIIDTNSEAKKPKQQGKNADLEALEKMQRDLEEREKNIAKVEQQQQSQYGTTQSGAIGSVNNFPPLPSWFCVKPCFYQNIEVDIPEEYRKIVRFAFILWICYVITLFVNVFATLTYMIDSSVTSDSGSLFGVSLLLFLLFVPLSYIFWFRPIYKAFRTNSSFSFFLFFFVFALQIIFLIIQALGIQVLGSSGWIVALTAKTLGVKIFMLLVAAAFTALVGAGVFLMIRVNIYFRSSGASYRKAQEELGQQAASHTGGVMAAAASSSLRS